MPRTLPRVLGVLLALAFVVPTPEASAQILGRLRRQQSPAQKSRYELDAIVSDEHQRLAEMKVELALLSDIATFPYEFAARANGKTLKLHGTVPNEMVRQRAMDVARSSTFLRGIDALTIQPNLSVRSSLLPPDVVQREGMELLQKEIGAAAKQMSLEAHPNGMVVLRGSIDCVESKLEISRLFRRLPGCTAVINELAVEPVLLDGQRMVRVTHNNMLLVPPSALEQGSEPVPTPAPAALVPERTPAIDRQPAASPQPQPTAPSPVPLRTSSLKAHEGELGLPVAAARNQANSPIKFPTEKVGGDWEAFAPSKLPVKWSRPGESLETQTKALETVNAPPTATPSQADRKQAATPQPSPKSEKLVRTPQVPARPQLKQLQLDPTLSRPAPTVWTRSFPVQNEPTPEKGNSRPNVAVKRESPESVMTWRRPGGSEEAEPKTAPAKTELRVPSPSSSPPQPEAPVAEKSPPPAIPSLRSSRRWPAAYVTGTPPSKGKSAVISLEDDDPPPTKPASAVIATSRSAGPDELQRQIKSLCGRQAREVVATVQKDGIVLIRVKVANRSIEDQLSRRILTLPEMSSPRVRLLMEIEP